MSKECQTIMKKLHENKKSLTRLAKKVELTRKVLSRRKDVTDVREQPPFL